MIIENKRTFRILFFSLMSIGLIFGALMLRNDSIRTSEGYVKAVKSRIKGQISELEANHSIIQIKLANDEVFVFAQTTESYLKRNFIRNTYKGDSIFKKAFSNKITIKHINSVYAYTILENDETD